MRKERWVLTHNPLQLPLGKGEGFFPFSPPYQGGAGGGSFRRAGGGFFQGFTLIELLIVVAIVAILAAIAIPNYLEAQVRAKVARTHSDLRTLGLALELYRVDQMAFPPARAYCLGAHSEELIRDFNHTPMELTTPVAYITSAPTDPFNRYPGKHYKYAKPGPGWFNGMPTVLSLWIPETFPMDNGVDIIHFKEDGAPVIWGLWSVGPGNQDNFWSAYIKRQPVPNRTWYDPTNGTVSDGVVVRLSTGHISR